MMYHLRNLRVIELVSRLECVAFKGTKYYNHTIFQNSITKYKEVFHEKVCIIALLMSYEMSKCYAHCQKKT